MSEVKRYIENLILGHPPPVVEASDGYLCLYTDFQSERAARIAAETKLAELEDAIKIYIYNFRASEQDRLNIKQAIANSRASSKS